MSDQREQNGAVTEVLLGTPAEAAPREGEVRYGFRVGELGLLVPRATFSEVVVDRPVYPLPNTQPWLEGVINDHGDMVPVYDLAILFGLGLSSGGKRNALLIIDQRDHAAAIRVRDYPRAVRGLEPEEALPPLPEPLQGAATTAWRAGDETWIDFRHRDFFEALKPMVAS